MLGDRMRLPPLNALRVFDAAARHANFRLAAVELCVSQAAVSQQIRLLEERLQRKLFERNARGVTLTEAGRSYLPPVRAALESIQEATEQLMAVRDGEKLALSVPPTFGIRWLMPRLDALRRCHPWIEVQLVVSISPVGTFPANADAAIWHGRGDWPGVVAQRLFRDDQLVPVCSPALLAGPIPLQEPGDLARHTLLHAQRELDDWRIWLASSKVEGVDPRKGPLFDSTSGAVQAASEGHGVAIGRGPFIDEDLKAGKLVAPFPARAQSASTYYLIRRSERLVKAAIGAFTQWILEEARPYR